jgi:5-amino-6-(5-phospho-D-ribitylamino)uracil phosphatase
VGASRNVQKNFKLIALDMDGTLLDANEKVPEENRRVIAEAQEKGVYVVLSTGRSILTCREYAESLKLSSYLVTVNGSEIWDCSGNLVERNLLPTDDIQMMWELARTHQTWFWAISTDKTWRGELPSDLYAREWLKFGFDIKDDVVREKILEKLTQNHQFEISNSSPTNIEVNAMGINKAKGLLHVCNKLGISMDEVLAIGDSLNDMVMIKEAGCGVAMGNAQDIVKEAADWVTGTNQEDGVAQAIRHWVL